MAVLAGLAGGVVAQSFKTSTINLSWHAPNSTNINDLHSVINGTGTNGFVFNSSQLPAGFEYAATYNWCNMPHVRPTEYPQAPPGYKLEYVEVIHRHHKRTPYASNTFPVEVYPWYCDDEGLFYSGAPLPTGNGSAQTYWSVYTSSSNPFAPEGFNGTCQFPQISRGGLDDSWQHGRDLFATYRDLLGFLPHTPNEQVLYRVTNNVITSQVASMLFHGQWNSSLRFPLQIQPDSIDSLEPTYACPAASALSSTYGVGSSNPNWTQHLQLIQPLFDRLDAVSGVDVTDPAWHNSVDHYFDNLSSRLCHGKPLPCNISNPTLCVTETDAAQIFRTGEYEYSFIYRDTPESLAMSVARYGVWVAELAQSFRDIGKSPVKYRHNVAHDGSVSLLLSILQVDVMVWPGMGAEVVFEVYSKGDAQYVRILWGGQVLKSSNPTIGVADMIPMAELLAYFDGLVGIGAHRIPALCAM